MGSQLRGLSASWGVLLCAAAAVDAQTLEAWVSRFTQSGCSDPWPGGDPEWKMKFWLKNDIDTAEKYSGCIGTNSGSVNKYGTWCKKGPTTGATTLTIRWEGEEDDGTSDDCTHDSGDDCKADGTCSKTVTPGTSGTFDCGNGNHRVYVTWKHITPSPTRHPTESPTKYPTGGPSGSPTPAPTRSPTTAAPTLSPTVSPTESPTAPTSAPSSNPSTAPSASPTQNPTTSPTGNPSTSPTRSPTKIPTGSPTLMPTMHACDDGSHGCHNISAGGICVKVGGDGWKCDCDKHYWCSAGCSGAHIAHECTLITDGPSAAPTAAPTVAPTVSPTTSPTFSPTTSPTTSPTVSPTTAPTQNPSTSPTVSPTYSPTTAPTTSPSFSPTYSPSTAPTTAPTVSPTYSPTVSPTQNPTTKPTGSPTWSPTTAPSTAPSTAPTTAPTSAPTTAPTGSPTTAPTTAPTQEPTTSPTMNPTWSPTTAPTSAPTTAPTTSPSWSPTVAPSTAPTAVPTTSPSWSPSPVPTAAPTAMPSAAPSSTPTSAPSTTPPTGAPKTSGPSAGPSVPPTQGPWVSPSEAPSVSPTPAPTLGKATGFAQGTADAGAVSAVLAVSAPAAAQGGRMAILATGCVGGKPEDVLPWTLHPTQLAIPGFTLPVHAGCVVANIGIAAAAAGLHFLATLFVQKVMNKGLLEARGMLRFPTGPVLLLAVLTQGPTFAGARLIRYAAGPIDVIVSIIGLVISAWVPLTVLYEGRRSQKLAVFKLDPTARRGCKSYWLGTGEWLSLPNKDKRNSFRVERWGIAFRAALPKKHSVLAVDVTLTLIVSFSAGIGGGTCPLCGIMRIGDAIAAFVLAGVVIRRRPYARPIRLPVTVLAQVLIAFGALALSVGYFSPGCGGYESVAAIFIAAGGLFTLMIVGLDGSAVLRGIQLGRRNQLAAALERFTAMDKNGSGQLEPHELREGLYQVYGTSIPDDEFKKLFARVDEDGSGEVDLHEFLASEHLFWDAGQQGGGGSRELRSVHADARGEQSQSLLAGSAAAMHQRRGSSPRRARRTMRGPSTPAPRSPLGHSRRASAFATRRPSSRVAPPGRQKPAFSLSGAGEPEVNGAYDEVAAGSKTGLVSPRRYKRRGGAAQVVRSGADGSWVIEMPLLGSSAITEKSVRISMPPAPGRRRGPRGQAQLQSSEEPPTPKGTDSAHGTFSTLQHSGAEPGGLAVLYTHPGGDHDESIPPRDGWSTAAQGVAPPPQVVAHGMDVGLEGLDEHNVGPMPGTSGPSPLWKSKSVRLDSPGLKRKKSRFSEQHAVGRGSFGSLPSAVAGRLGATAPARPPSQPSSPGAIHQPPSPGSFMQVRSTNFEDSSRPSPSSSMDGQYDWATMRAATQASIGTLDPPPSLRSRRGTVKPGGKDDSLQRQSTGSSAQKASRQGS
eukprot:TRINITY_DN43015_c0_g1_i1.p1 TRINITY_DN43015_c0_g1~~TRINITY_DN43015_c0_g1_i1.p1  ORF type:complete len:1414 (+),score=234.37 TRINITY_DN43015_c0_g1_i1:77-4318(+)